MDFWFFELKKWNEGKRVTPESLHTADGFTIYGGGRSNRRPSGLVAHGHCETRPYCHSEPEVKNLPAFRAFGCPLATTSLASPPIR
jgi:hypothetical protein